MQKVAITGERQAALVDVAEPQPKENWAVIKVHAAPMCTEYKTFVSGTPNAFLGHEAAGEVVAVAQPCKVKVGDRVVAMPLYGCGTCALCLSGDYIHCEHNVDFVRFTGSPEGRATYAQYLLKPDWLLLPIPDDMSYERASLACCAIGPSFGAFELLGLKATDTVLITGLGPVGLGAIANARFRNAAVIAAEFEPYRAAKGEAMGATIVDPRDPDVVSKIKALTGGRGVDCALDCAGAVAAQRLCLDATRRKGKVAFVGECQDELALRISPDMLRRGHTLIGSWHYNLNVFPQVMQVIARSPLIDALVSHVFPMRYVQDAFELCATHQTGKVILKPWE